MTATANWAHAWTSPATLRRPAKCVACGIDWDGTGDEPVDCSGRSSTTGETIAGPRTR